MGRCPSGHAAHLWLAHYSGLCRWLWQSQGDVKRRDGDKDCQLRCPSQGGNAHQHLFPMRHSHSICSPLVNHKLWQFRVIHKRWQSSARWPAAFNRELCGGRRAPQASEPTARLNPQGQHRHNRRLDCRARHSATPWSRGGHERVEL